MKDRSVMAQDENIKGERKHILIVVAGLTPAIITETLQFLTFAEPGKTLRYGDLMKRKVRLKISDIFVLTTSKGRDMIMDELIKNGGFRKFCDEFGINWVSFDEKNIIVLRDTNGVEIEDIRTVEENRGAANMLFDFIRQKLMDENIIVHCSIAGGRKSMDVYSAFAFQFYGKSEDKMYHVIVNSPFDDPNLKDKSGRRFLYIPIEEVVFTRKLDKSEHTSMGAEITLYEIPYIHLRSKLKDILQSNESYDKLVDIAQREIDLVWVQPHLYIDVKRGSVKINDWDLVLKPTELFIYLYFVFSRKMCKQRHGKNLCSFCFPEFEEVNGLKVRKFKNWEPLLKAFRIIRKNFGDKSKETKTIENWIYNGIPRQSLSDKICDINKRIKEIVQIPNVDVVKIVNEGKYSKPRYGIRLEPGRIELIK
jgi:CRISPR-associated protein (TIGR02584 family)